MATRTINVSKSNRVSNPNKSGGGRYCFGTSSRVLNTSGRGRGRGGGRGRRRASKSSISKRIFVVKDEEDNICQLALGQFELETSSISKALENAAATTPKGFDETAGQIWIYPTNRPVRDYQFKIVQTALFHNTLVSLPTGLGKTFIAAVVIYNFARWYPNSIIVFMAPSRPLVAQQLQACHEIVGIHPSKTVELTGAIAPKRREEFWKTKSVFFLTPQVLQSDLGRGVVPAERVRCVVVDEAHKALGEQAFVVVISELVKAQASFRVLALSATPGSDLASVGQVLKNLLISRLELRSENSPDVLPYVHDRNVEKVVVKLDDYLANVYERVMEIFQEYTGKLLKNRAIHGSSFSQFQLLQGRTWYRENMQDKVPKYLCSYIENDFQVAISMARAVELLHFYGLRSFYTFIRAILNKEKATPIVSYELNKHEKLAEIMSEIQQKLNITSATNSLNNSSLFTTFSKQAQDINNLPILEDQHPQNYLDSHPKMRKLKDIVLAHFKSFENKNSTTRIMIFCEYRDSVQEIGSLLSNLGALVKPMVFIGQSNTGSRGLKQKDQIEVMQRFREGGYNVLVSTCVGEEGLDIGEVDLIICFDSKRSPTRLVQRMGRTGRQRAGKIIFLLTEGKEEKSYNSSCSLQSNISKQITDGSKLSCFLYKSSPRMIPAELNPQCFKMNILLTSEQGEKEGVEIIEVDDEGCEVFAKPTIAIAPPIKKKKSSKSRPKTANTIKDCFNQMLLKQNDGIPKIPKKSVVDYVAELRQPDNNFEDEHHEPHFDFDNQEDGVLMSIFDVPDPSTFFVKPCLKIPKPAPSFEWLEEYNELDPSLVLLSEYDISCLLQKVKGLKIADGYKTKCECGKIGDEAKKAEDEVFLDEEDDFLLQFDSIPTEPMMETMKNDENNQFCGDDVDDWIKEMDDFQIAKPVSQKKQENCGASKLHRQIKIQNSRPKKSNPVVSKQKEYSSLMASSSAQKFTFKKKEMDTEKNVKATAKNHLSKQDFGNISASPIKIFESLNGDDIISPKFEKLNIRHHSTPKASRTYFEGKRAESPIIIDFDSDSLTGDEELFKNYSTPVTLKMPSSKINDLSDSETADEEEILEKSRTKSFVEHALKKQPQIAVVSPFSRTIINTPVNKSERVITSNTKDEDLKSQTDAFDPELFKDDLLMFEDDDLTEDLFEPSMINYNSKLEDNKTLSPLKITPPEKKLEGALKERENKENIPVFSLFPQTEGIRYFPHLTLPSTPPSIFNRKKNKESLIVDETNTIEESKPAISNPKPVNMKIEGMNSDSDDDLRDLNLTEVEKAFINGKLEDFELKARQQKEKSSTETQNFKKKAGFSPKKFTFKPILMSKLPASKSCSIGRSQVATSSTSSGFFNAPKNQQIPNKTINSNNINQPKTSTSSKSGKPLQIFKKPVAAFSDDDDDDDDFVRSRTKKTTTPNRKNESRSTFLRNVIPSPKSNFDAYNNSSVFASSPISRHSKCSTKKLQRRKKKQIKLAGNPFLHLEADVSGDESNSGSCSSEDEFEGLDEYDGSFVDHEDEIGITDSQQAHYLQSIKDVVPVYTRKTQQRVCIQNGGDISHIEDRVLGYDENDSFCVANDESVEIEDVGVYTQAMNNAREEILSENSIFARKRKTRRGASQAKAKKVESESRNTKIKTRKRIIMQDESSSD